MARRNLRVRIDEDGRLEVVDPGFDTLALIRSLNPEWDLRQGALPGFSMPKFLKSGKWMLPPNFIPLIGAGREIMGNPRRKYSEAKRDKGNSTRNAGEASLLDLKIEIGPAGSCRLPALRT